jgi:glutaredoxin 3
MAQRRKIEIFTAGCPACSEMVELVKRMVGSAHNVEMPHMHQADIAARAKGQGIRSLPSVVIDGGLAGCCAERGPEEQVLRKAIGGSPAADRGLPGEIGNGYGDSALRHPRLRFRRLWHAL